MFERKQSNKLYIMLKNILKLDGAQQLSKNEQKEINGGIGVTQANCVTNALNNGCRLKPATGCIPVNFSTGEGELAACSGKVCCAI